MLKIMNCSSLDSEQVMDWCHTTFPQHTLKLLAAHETEAAQDSTVLVFYDSLQRCIDLSVLTAGGDLAEVLAHWVRDTDKVLEQISQNPERRICVDADADMSAPDVTEALGLILGPLSTGPSLNHPAPVSDLAQALTHLLLQQDQHLQDKRDTLARMSAGATPQPAISVSDITRIAADIGGLHRALNTLQQDLSQREHWLEKLRSAIWEANTRAQTAEGRLRDLTSQMNGQNQIHNYLAHHQTTAPAAQPHVAGAAAAEVAALRAEVDALRSSTSWKVTAPIRWLKLRLDALRR